MQSALFFRMFRSASVLTELNLSARLLLKPFEILKLKCSSDHVPEEPGLPCLKHLHHTEHCTNHSSHNCFHSLSKDMKVWADEEYRIYGKNGNVDGDCGDKRRSTEGGESWTVVHIPILYWTITKNAKIVQGTRMSPKWILSSLSTTLMLSVAFF